MLNDSPSTVDKQTVPMGTASNPTNSIPDNVPVTTNDELVTAHPTVKTVNPDNPGKDTIVTYVKQVTLGPNEPGTDAEPQVIPNDSTEKIQVIERSNGNDKSPKKIQARMKDSAFNKSMQGKDLPQTGNETPNHLIGLGLLIVSLMMLGFKRKKQN